MGRYEKGLFICRKHPNGMRLMKYEQAPSPVMLERKLPNFKKQEDYLSPICSKEAGDSVGREIAANTPKTAVRKSEVPESFT